MNVIIDLLTDEMLGSNRLEIYKRNDIHNQPEHQLILSALLLRKAIKTLFG